MKEKAVLVCKESTVKELFDELGVKVLAENNLFVKVLPDHLFSTLFEINTNKVDVDMSDEVFNKIALMAQENNITFDMQVSDILKKQIDENKEGPSNWRLPTIDELNIMYENLYKKDIGGFAYEYYWSSPEDSSNFMGYQYFGNGVQYGRFNKDVIGRVRAVRVFKLQEGDAYRIGQKTSTGFIFDIQRDVIFECKKEDEPKLMNRFEAINKFGEKQ